MAKIHTETIVVTINRLVKESSDAPKTIVGKEITSTLEDVVQELVGDAAVVEVEIV